MARFVELPLTAGGAKLLIGLIHLRPLPGSPRYSGGFDAVLEGALADTEAWENGGADALCIENYGDAPFWKSAVPPETIAAMAAVGAEIRRSSSLPLGFNVLRNDSQAALALCAACGGSFLRVNVLANAAVTDQGILEGEAASLLRARSHLDPRIRILADLRVKHAAPLSPRPIEEEAVDLVERALADGIILTGPKTGAEPLIEEVERVRSVLPLTPILAGSGIHEKNLQRYLAASDGVLVGSSAKEQAIDTPVDRRKVEKLTRLLHIPPPSRMGPSRPE
ncbi:Putative sgc region protein SgcQ [Methylacidimicrobium cyclopophantes]|uniref:Sgc region protein SgcQ n=1 Tax=Methylacidimicrobium cyclopophantes TaxID=1041766 RepID=A0A5E6M9U1_9BACT|nr:BtpA/SgcQ family protein [Methylacidimicrobium cyclopophantes]VVM05068.1 Putative sgc region protein SgcQ [Methylacidimicrobium cyclopophantes]